MKGENTEGSRQSRRGNKGKKASGGGEIIGRRNGETENIPDYMNAATQHIGMWEGVWRRAGEKTLTPRGDG